MKQTIDIHQFRAQFETIRKDNFSYRGLTALYEYLEEYEDSTGEEVELDVIAICVEYTEYADLKEFQANYGAEYETIEDIEDATTVIPVGKEGFIICDF